MDTVIAEPRPPERPTIIDSGDAPTTPLPPEFAAVRAAKASLGLGIDYDSTYSKIIEGREDQLRQIHAADKELQRQSRLQSVLTNVAAAHGRPLTKEEQEYTLHLVRNQSPVTPRDVFEDAWSSYYVNNLRRDSAYNEELSDSWWREAEDAVPGIVKKTITDGVELETKKSVMHRELQNVQTQLQQQSTVGYMADFAKGFVPLYNQLKKGYGFYLPGEVAEEESSKWFMMPLPEFKEKFPAYIQSIAKDNPQLAASFIAEMLGQSSTERTLNNFFSVIDYTALKPIALAKGLQVGAKQIYLANLTRNAVKTMMKEVDPKLTEGAVKEASGDLSAAALKDATAIAVKDIKGTNDPRQLAISAMQNYLKSAITGLQSSTMRQELVNRLVERYTAVFDSLTDAVSRTMRVDRLSAVLAVEKNVQNIMNKMKGDYPGLNNRILDIMKPIYEPASNTHFVEFRFGDEGATLFKNEGTAKAFARQAGLSSAVVNKDTQKGVGWYVSVMNPLKEDQAVVRDAMLATSETKTPDSWLNAWGGWLGSARTPEETLALQQRINRKLAIYSDTNFIKVAEDAAKEIRQLRRWQIPGLSNRARWQQWKDVVNASRLEPDPGTGKIGRLFDNIDQLNLFYNNKLHRLPDEQEIAAYFAYKKSEEINRVYQMVSEARDLNRQGAKTISFQVVDPSQVSKTGKSFGLTQPWQFNGRKLQAFPSGIGSGDHSILFIGGKLGEEKLLNTTSLKGKTLAAYRKDVESGTLQMFEVAYPGDYPLAGFGKVGKDTRVKYVIGKKLEEKDLDWGSLGKGRPADYDHEFNAAQAVVKYDPITKIHTYERDQNIAGFMIPKMGRDFVNKLDSIRQLLKAGDAAGADTYLKANRLPFELSQIQQWVKEGRLDLDQPVRFVPKGKMIGHMDDQLTREMANRDRGFRDGTREHYGRSKGPDNFDIFTVSDEGTKGNPLYKVDPARVVDPMTSINRALRRSINGVVMDDYKIFSVEHWIQEAKAAGILKHTDEELASAPAYYFHNPQFYEGSNIKALNNLKTARFQIQQLLGVANPHETFLHSLAQHLADATYSKLGPTAALVPLWLVPKLKNPEQAIRSLIFHAKLGLFNIPQLLVQLQTFTTILGIAGPKMALPGTKAALLHVYSTINRSPEMLNYLDKLASTKLIPGTSHWRPGEWKEANDWLVRSGFEHVGSEYALRGDPHSMNLVPGVGSTFLKWGAMPFTAGEKGVRMGAWYTAFREFRDANPTGAISEVQAKTILERADLLYTNMSRASSSTLHTGILSIPAQFLSYQLRLFELFTGKRLTDVERTRLLITYAVAYGVPTSFGVLGFPIGDYIRRQALEEGYVVGENWIKSLVMEGGPALLTALATGEPGKRLQTGNWYNIGERYGMQGFEFLRDLAKADKSWFDFLGGAAWSTFKNTIEATDGFSQATMSMIRRDGKFSYTPEDFIDPFKEISSFNNAWKLIAAFNIGRMLTKKEGNMGEVTKGNAVFQFLTGLSPQESVDFYKQRWTHQVEKELHDHVEKRAIMIYRRGLQAMKDNNPTQATTYFNNALNTLAAGGYPEHNMSKFFALALKDNEDMPSRGNWDFYIGKDVSETRRDIGWKTYPTVLQKQFERSK